MNNIIYIILYNDFLIQDYILFSQYVYNLWKEKKYNISYIQNNSFVFFSENANEKLIKFFLCIFYIIDYISINKIDISDEKIFNILKKIYMCYSDNAYISYLDDNIKKYKFIGNGSSAMVYKISNDLVLKIRKIKTKFDQYNNFYQYLVSYCIEKIFIFIVQNLNKQKIDQILGFKIYNGIIISYEIQQYYDIQKFYDKYLYKEIIQKLKMSYNVHLKKLRQFNTSMLYGFYLINNYFSFQIHDINITFYNNKIDLKNFTYDLNQKKIIFYDCRCFCNYTLPKLYNIYKINQYLK